MGLSQNSQGVGGGELGLSQNSQWVGGGEVGLSQNSQWGGGGELGLSQNSQWVGGEEVIRDMEGVVQGGTEGDGEPQTTVFMDTDLIENLTVDSRGTETMTVGPGEETVATVPVYSTNSKVETAASDIRFVICST